MAQLMILGSASAVPGQERENTHLYLKAGDRSILIDAPGRPVIRLEEAGIDPLGVTDIILTHFHPDHVAGFPALLMDIWLMGKRSPIRVYGLEHTIERTKKMMELYESRAWPDFFEVQYFTLPEEEHSLVMETDAITIHSSPVCHLIPTIGLRMEFLPGKEVIVYSCDTEPCPSVVRLAKGADVLIHEATGESPGHTSPTQAGKIASQAGVKELYLIHFSPDLEAPECLIEEAKSTFSGRVYLTSDLQVISVK